MSLGKQMDKGQRKERAARWLTYLAISGLLIDACLQFPYGRVPASYALIFIVLVALVSWKSKLFPLLVLPLMAAAFSNIITHQAIITTTYPWLPLANVTVVSTIALSWIRVPWYILLAVSAILLRCLDEIYDLHTAILIYLSVTFVVVLFNFGVKLVADNWNDFIKALRWLKKLDAIPLSFHTVRALWLSVPAVAFLILGVHANLWMQKSIVDNLYTSSVIDSPDDVADREIERDTYATLDKRELRIRERILLATSEAEVQSSALADDWTGKVMWAVTLFTPTAPDIKSACEGFVTTGEARLGRVAGLIRRITSRGKQGRTISFGVDHRSGCATSMQAASDHAAKAHNDASKELQREMDLKKKEILEKQSAAMRTARDDALVRNFETFQRARWLAHRAFWLAPKVGYASWAFIAIGFLGLLVYLFGRTTFDQGTQVPFSLKKTPGVDDEPPALPILPCYLREKELNLSASLQWPDLSTRQETFWYVAHDIPRHGDKTNQRLRIPQWYNSFFRRLFTNKLALTLVPITDDTTYPPTISAPGDVVLVDIIVDGDREVVFHMDDLAAFSGGIEINSIYSMHAATELLGLGAFYCIAKGSGRLILKSQGCEVKMAPANKSLPAGLLLAWDHRAQFKLTQDITQMGTWMNTASVLSVHDHLAVYDESRPGDPLIIAKLWRLARFAAIPV